MMTLAVQDNLSAQLSANVLTSIQQLAAVEGREVQALLDEALQEYIDRKTKAQVNQQVLNAFADSIAEFDSLYTELAK
jgi:predicted transcriptional regulator